MMNEEQSKIVKLVYNRFAESEEYNFRSEKTVWTELDENLEFISYLSEQELINESKIKVAGHSKGTFKCEQNHEQRNCFAPYILESVQYILKLYDETGFLHEKNSYILSYYLAMSAMGMIFSEVSSAV